MRFMMLLKADKTTEAGVLPTATPFHLLPGDGRVPEIELRQMFELADFQGVLPEVARMEENFPSQKK